MSESGSLQILSQGVGYGIIVGIGIFFALTMLLLTRLQNHYTTYSSHAVEEFATASRSVKPGLIAAGIVSSWTWPAHFSPAQPSLHPTESEERFNGRAMDVSRSRFSHCWRWLLRGRFRGCIHTLSWVDTGAWGSAGGVCVDGCECLCCEFHCKPYVPFKSTNRD